MQIRELPCKNPADGESQTNRQTNQDDQKVGGDNN